MSNGMKFQDPPQPPQEQKQETGTGFGKQKNPLGHILIKQSKKKEEDKAKEKSSSRQGKQGTGEKRIEHSTIGTGPPGQKNRPPAGGQDDNFDRVIAMLKSIRKGVGPLVKTEVAGVPKTVNAELRDSWPHVERSFDTSVTALESREDQFGRQLEASGFTDEMLDMKETSLKYQMERLDKAILTYGKDKTKLEKFIGWIKPCFSAIKSILGSLSGIPGVEIIKEFMEHLESIYETVEAGQPE